MCRKPPWFTNLTHTHNRRSSARWACHGTTQTSWRCSMLLSSSLPSALTRWALVIPSLLQQTQLLPRSTLRPWPAFLCPQTKTPSLKYHVVSLTVVAGVLTDGMEIPCLDVNSTKYKFAWDGTTLTLLDGTAVKITVTTCWPQIVVGVVPNSRLWK